MSDAELPVSVVLPTLNVRPGLPAHLSAMRLWAERVYEIVVVDSHSTDGTFEFLQAELRHPRLKLLRHPPGLYQSWNYGIQQAAAKYTYISTIGDTITPEGLPHLVDTAETLRCEVLLSRPQLYDAEGQPFPGRRWPLHKFLDWRPLAQPARLEPWEVLLLAILDVPESILGSSASNLYLSQMLKSRPFPTDYGHAGDTAWGIQHGWQAAVAVTPLIFSRFVLEVTGSRLAPEAEARLVERFYGLADQTASQFLARLPGSSAPQQLLPRIFELLSAMQRLLQIQQRYYRARRSLWPWFLNPGAWGIRDDRNRVRKNILQMARAIRQQLDLASAPGARAGLLGPNESPGAVPEYLCQRILEKVA